MSTILRVTALFVAIATIGLWFFGGFNLGRTQTVVPVEQPGADGQTLIVREARYLPGLDFLAGGCLLSVVLLVTSTRWPASRSPAAHS
jgi:hypothetical protein